MGLVILVWFVFLGCVLVFVLGVAVAAATWSRRGRVHPVAWVLLASPVLLFAAFFGLLLVGDSQRQSSLDDARSNLATVAESTSTVVHSRLATGGRCTRAVGYTDRPVPGLQYISDWDGQLKQDELRRLEDEMATDGWQVTPLRLPEDGEDGALVRRDDVQAMIAFNHFELMGGYGDFRGPGDFAVSFRIEVWDGIGCEPEGRP